MILIAGASGQVGTEVCRLLRARDLPVRALVRRTTNPVKIKRLQGMGAELTEGDVQDPASLNRACQGVQAVVSAVTSFGSGQPGDTFRAIEQEGQINLIDAARANGVEHFIPSTYGVNPNRLQEECPLVESKAAAEQYLINSGVPYTIFYTGAFMESWLSPMMGFDPVNAKARIYGSGQNPVSYVALGDVAQVIVVCLTNPPFRNRVLELGGPESLPPLQVVRVFEEESGRKFEVEFVPEEAIATMQASARDPMQKTISGLLKVVSRGLAMESIQSEIPLALKTVREYAQSVVGRVKEPG